MSELPYPAWPELFRWLTILKDRVETIVAISAEQVITGEFDPDLIPPIPWDRVLKAGSSLGDLETTSAGDLSSGTLLAARMPALTGDVSSVVGTVATTLATVNPHPGTYGAGMTIPLISVNAKGLVTDIVDYPIAGSPFTPGSVIFAGALGQFAEDNANLFWDDAFDYLGIGTAPGSNLHVYADTLSAGGSTPIVLVETGDGDAVAGLALKNDAAKFFNLRKWGSTVVGDAVVGVPLANLSIIDATTTPLLVNSSTDDIIFGGAGVETARLTNAGKFGIGLAPTAFLTLKAGTTVAATAPLKFTSGSLLTSAEVGAVEFLTDAFYGTITTGAARKQFLFTDGSITGLTGTLGVTHGGTGTATAFTAGSVVFAGTSGVYAQDNANLFWDDTNDRLGIGNAAPVATVDVTGTLAVNPGTFFSSVDSTAVFVARGTTNTAWFYLTTGANVVLSSNVAATSLSTSKASLVLNWRGFRWDGAVNQELIAIAALTPNATIDNSRLSFGFSDNDGNMLNLTHGTKLGMGTTNPTARFHIMAGTATANTAPLKFTSGTNLTTAEAGALEYDGTDLFFTRAGTVRENVLVAIDNVAAPTTSIGVAIVNFYGANATNYLGDPNRWLSVNVLGATYKIPLYT